MKNGLFIACIYCFILNVLPAQQSDILDINNIKARVWYDGDLFWDKQGNQAFEYPNGSGKHADNLSGLWIVGKDSNNNVVGAVTFNRPNALTNSDFYSGPLDTTCTTPVDSETIALYKRVWKVSRAEIEMYQLCNCIDPSNPICLGYTVPNSIKQWPGNPILQVLGQNLNMALQLAPYHDADGDGIYDWTNCDYPLIKGEQAIFWVMNDQGGNHSISGLPTMNVEVRCMAYATNCNSFMNDVVFVDYQIVNRCQQEINDVYIGMYSSADAGNGSDDYIGTNAQKGYMYHYNGDLSDAQYSNSAIATATVLWQGPPMRFNGTDDLYDLPSIASLTDTTTASGAYGLNGRFYNDGTNDNEYLGLTRSIGFLNDTSITGNPSASNHYYNFLRGFWKDNSRMVYGGMGYPSGPFAAAPKANFIYPNLSDPDNAGTFGIATSFNWSEFTNGATFNIPGDRRMLAGTGPIQLKQNEYIYLTYAFMPSMQSNASDSLGIELLELKVDSLLAYRDSIFTSSNLLAANGAPYNNIICPSNYTVLGNEELPDANGKMIVFPNPSKGIVNIKSFDQLIRSYDIIDVSGRIIFQSEIINLENNATVNLSSYAEGIYYIMVHTTENNYTRKILLTK